MLMIPTVQYGFIAFFQKSSGMVRELEPGLASMIYKDIFRGYFQLNILQTLQLLQSLSHWLSPVSISWVIMQSQGLR